MTAQVVDRLEQRYGVDRVVALAGFDRRWVAARHRAGWAEHPTVAAPARPALPSWRHPAGWLRVLLETSRWARDETGGLSFPSPPAVAGGSEPGSSPDGEQPGFALSRSGQRGPRSRWKVTIGSIRRRQAPPALKVQARASASHSPSSSTGRRWS